MTEYDSPTPAWAEPEANFGLSAATRTIADLVRERDELRTENARLTEQVLGEREGTNRVMRHKAEVIRDLRAKIEALTILTESLSARGPYCAQHGEHQPCSQHKWVRESEHP